MLFPNQDFSPECAEKHFQNTSLVVKSNKGIKKSSSESLIDAEVLDEVNRKLWANQEPDQKDKNPLEIIALCSFYSENYGQGEEHFDQ